ncbi:hypothetical protein [Natronorubrum halophilum]|uniref:hypothetical protein n=1 Tax=Natronorubrum halophilum TaxID=1702106 RepID=UPI000EF69AC5|nr:hypothetical protein [Natronorubrum halophilum]
MTTRDRPAPPTALDQDALEELAPLADRDADQLRAIGTYLEALAAWKEGEADERPDSAADSDADGGESDRDGIDGEYPEDVPERASVTTKEIAGTAYTYYQWRDGDRIESKTVRRE